MRRSAHPARPDAADGLGSGSSALAQRGAGGNRTYIISKMGCISVGDVLLEGSPMPQTEQSNGLRSANTPLTIATARARCQCAHRARIGENSCALCDRSKEKR